MGRRTPAATTGLLALLIFGTCVVLAGEPGTRPMLVGPDELDRLALGGPAWDELLAEANEETGIPTVSDASSNVNVQVLAKALVYARTGVGRYRDEVIAACMAIMGTENGGRTLALGRELASYVIAAELVVLPEEEDAVFRAWLDHVRFADLDGRTLISTHEDRPNNWGTHAGASRLAVAIYLGDTAEIENAAIVFKGWLGDRESYSGFAYGDDLTWQSDPESPVGINPVGSTIDGFPVDGVLPDDQRRGGSFIWPPEKVGYVYEALQGALLQAILLERRGYDPFEWEDRALLRAYRWLHEHAAYSAEGDDRWQPYVVNYYYDMDFPVQMPAQPGKNVGWTDWLLGSGTQLYRMNREAAGDVTLTWRQSCDPANDDYEIYSGIIGDWENYSSMVCTTEGETSFTVPDDGENRFYLIVPRDDVYEGSYGTDGDGVQRPAGGSPCLPMRVTC